MRKTQSKTDTENGEDIERRLQDLQDKDIAKNDEIAAQRYNAREALESMTGIKFSATHGDSSKNLIDFISDIKYSEKGNLIALKYKGEDVKLTAKGKLDRRSANTDNKKILKAIDDAKKELNASINGAVSEAAGTSMSDEAVKSVQENVIEDTNEMIWDMYGVIRERDIDGNTFREINGIPHVDDGVDYDNLDDPNQKTQYDSKIAGLKVDIEHWKERAEKEQNPSDKLLYKTAKELCILKKSEMEMKADLRPESEDAQTRIKEETERNDFTRFERFKKWAKENITGVSAVAISIAGVVTAAVLAGRNAAKKGAKAVGNFGKALANLAKKAGPAIAAILNFVAQAITWGAKALEFLSRNLWIVALFLTYLLYDTVKERVRNKK